MLLYMYVLLLLILLYYVYRKTDYDFFSPVSVFCLSFLISTLLAIIKQEEWQLDLGWNTFTVLVVGTTAFVAFGLLMIKDCAFYNNDKTACLGIEFRRIFIWGYAVGLAITIYQYYKFTLEIGGENTISESMYAVRLMFNRDELELPPMLENLFLFYRSTILFIAYKFSHDYIWSARKNIFCILIIGGIFFLSALSGARGYIFYSVMSSMIIFIVLWRRKNGWHIEDKLKVIEKMGVFCMGIVALVCASVFAMGRREFESLQVDIWDFCFDYISRYVGGEIKGLDFFIEDVYSPLSSGLPFGYYTLVGLYGWINKHFSYINWADGYSQDYFSTYYFANGQIIGNVYTCFAPQYQDGGLLAVFAFSGMFGAIMMFLYRKVRFKKIHKKGIDWWLFIYSYFFYTIPLSFFYGFFYNMLAPGLWKIAFFWWMFNFIFVKKRMNI